MTVGFVVLLSAMLWKIGADPAERPEDKFRRDLRSLMILVLLSSSVLFACWVWVLVNELTVRLEVALVASSAVAATIVRQNRQNLG